MRPPCPCGSGTRSARGTSARASRARRTGAGPRCSSEGAENSPKYLLSEELSALAFHAHPYHWPVIGWKSDLQRIQRDELYAYYLQHYAPNNAGLALAGRFDPEDAMRRVRGR